jgi:hypothetical protein
VRERGWVEARDLRTGDTFETRDGGSEKVLGTSLVKGDVKVYNFEVERTHTYYVYAGSKPVLVHNDCLVTLIKDLVRPGDHIVLGVNPFSDKLAAFLKGAARTFNGKAYSGQVEFAGGRPAWMVGVENAVPDPAVELSVTLDGVIGAETADDAIKLLSQRGDTIPAGNWQMAAEEGYGTAWEMTEIRRALRLEKRPWESIKWYMKDGDGFARVYPSQDFLKVK